MTVAACSISPTDCAAGWTIWTPGWLARRAGGRINNPDSGGDQAAAPTRMSVMALLFLPASFLTGLFGINLGSMPGPREPDRLLGLLRISAGAGDRAGGLARYQALVVRSEHDDMGIFGWTPLLLLGLP